MSSKKQRYIPIGKELIPVSEETYLYHSRWIANERYRARRDHRCGTDNYTKCNGDCGHCIHQIPGDVLSMNSIIHVFLTKAYREGQSGKETERNSFPQEIEVAGGVQRGLKSPLFHFSAPSGRSLEPFCRNRK